MEEAALRILTFVGGLVSALIFGGRWIGRRDADAEKLAAIERSVAAKVCEHSCQERHVAARDAERDRSASVDTRLDRLDSAIDKTHTLATSIDSRTARIEGMLARINGNGSK